LNRQEKIKVLYIDDEPNNLHGFKATFRFEYNVLTAVNTQDALEYLENMSDIQIILCDQRMPDKTGVQFFEEIRQMYPLPVRMLITGYADIESVIDGINRGNIFRYIKKPWTDADIQTAIEEAYKFYVTSTLLANKNNELQRAYDELDKFAYSVTHDMRGPLLSVTGALDIIKHSNNIDEIKEFLALIDKSIQKLDDFVKNVHEYYTLKRGKLVFTEVDFNKIVADLSEIFELTGWLRDVKFITEVKQEEPFRTDVNTLMIVLNNLLSNAFKYQRKNEQDKFVDLEIRVEKNTAHIRVTDNGIGIQEMYLKDIFNMFFRATSEASGSGFGLYNVKDALKRLGGTVTVESVPDQGSSFHVVIPGK
jgi:two-component system, sensor histidine kinase and response regulator